jgi:DNA replication and repair protein RecF
LQGEERETAIGLTKDKQGDSKVRIDGTDGHKVAELALLMPMQLITPEGFTLLNGGPKYRRAFLDWGCFHNEAGFFNAWSNLKRLLKQRNAALRQVTRYAQLRPWDMELIPLAEQISRWRAEYSAGIAEDMADTCKQFLPEFSLTFSFQRGWEKETDYAEVLEKLRARPHVDLHRARPAQGGFPHSCRRCAGGRYLVARAAQAPDVRATSGAGEFFTRESGRRCLYLIDDFASELDDARRGLLASRLKATQSQVFVSAISAEHVMDMSDENSKMFTVEKGKITD